MYRYPKARKPGLTPAGNPVAHKIALLPSPEQEAEFLVRSKYAARLRNALIDYIGHGMKEWLAPGRTQVGILDEAPVREAFPITEPWHKAAQHYVVTNLAMTARTAMRNGSPAPRGLGDGACRFLLARRAKDVVYSNVRLRTPDFGVIRYDEVSFLPNYGPLQEFHTHPVQITVVRKHIAGPTPNYWEAYLSFTRDPLIDETEIETVEEPKLGTWVPTQKAVPTEAKSLERIQPQSGTKFLPPHRPEEYPDPARALDVLGSKAVVMADWETRIEAYFGDEFVPTAETTEDFGGGWHNEILFYVAKHSKRLEIDFDNPGMLELGDEHLTFHARLKGEPPLYDTSEPIADWKDEPVLREGV